MLMVPSFLVAVAAAVQFQHVCALHANGEDTLGGVNEADLGFVVAIQPKYTQNGLMRKSAPCLGVLIEGVSEQREPAYYVLTSGSCVLSGTSFDLFAGRASSGAPPDHADALAETAIVHEQFLLTLADSDLALIPTTISPSGSTAIRAVKVPNIEDGSKSNLFNRVTMAAWRYSNDSAADPADPWSPTLREVSSWVAPNWYCTLRDWSHSTTQQHLCTLNISLCAGESGAPLISRTAEGGTRVIGIATHAPWDGCRQPGVFTRLAGYLDWVSTTTNYDPEQ